MTHKVVFRPSALRDIDGIYDWIADNSDAETAAAYVRRLRTACLALADFPHRGTRRDDLVQGLRTISFEGRATIAYLAAGRQVRILRILHRGRDLGLAFGVRP